MLSYADCLEILCPNNVQADISALNIVNCSNQPQEKKEKVVEEKKEKVVEEQKEKNGPSAKSLRHRLD